MGLKTIHGVEVFASGTWNGDTYGTKDLDEMVRAFEETKGQFKPYLKLGHDKNQKLLQADGLPAAGWIGSVYRMGEKLMADFIDIPEKIFQLISNKAYRKVSSEIYWNLKVGDKKYPFVLGAVALLGADTPAVGNLNDILSQYGLKIADKIKIYADGENADSVKQYSFIPEKAEDLEMPKSESELKLEIELQAEKDARTKADAEVKKYAQDQKEKDDELTKLRAEKAESDKKAADAVLKAEATEVEAYAEGKLARKEITPAMKPILVALCGAEVKEYSVKCADGAEKKFSKRALIDEMLKLHTAKDGVSVDGKTEGGKESIEGNSDEAIQAKIDEYIKSNPAASYRAAYKAVTATLKPRAAKPMGMAEAEA